ncbi:MAG: cytochrome c3 family protein [Chloroflexi bacterium]|nr:cytochrome c3 family protein [Chloroflexota bacterium]
MQPPGPKPRRRLLIWAVLALASVLLVALGLAVVPRVLAHYFWPVERFYFKGAPVQPIEFPHPTHVQTAGIDCVFCHRTVTEEKMAGIPAVEQCMFCHKVIAKDRPEIQKLASYFDLGEPINWVRVHRLPDHVHFVHEAHISFFSQRDNILPSQVCATCHGDVENMLRVQQIRPLKMGDCVDCHRANNAPTDCVACHY